MNYCQAVRSYTSLSRFSPGLECKVQQKEYLQQCLAWRGTTPNLFTTKHGHLGTEAYDFLFVLLRCFFQPIFLVPHPPTPTSLGKWGVTHNQGEETTGETLGEFKGAHIFTALTLWFFCWICPFGILLPRPLEQYKGHWAASHVGASGSGKAKQEQDEAQGMMTQSSCSQPQEKSSRSSHFLGSSFLPFSSCKDLSSPR